MPFLRYVLPFGCPFLHVSSDLLYIPIPYLQQLQQPTNRSIKLNICMFLSYDTWIVICRFLLFMLFLFVCLFSHILLHLNSYTSITFLNCCNVLFYFFYLCISHYLIFIFFIPSLCIMSILHFEISKR